MIKIAIINTVVIELNDVHVQVHCTIVLLYMCMWTVLVTGIEDWFQIEP